MMKFVAADVLTELVNPDGTVATPPAFRRPTDAEWQADPERAAELAAQADEAEIVWQEDHKVHAHRYCSVDRTLVTVTAIGTSWTATCPSGHRWLRTFGANDGWRQTR